METEEKLLAQLADQDEWIDLLEESLTETEIELRQLYDRFWESECRTRRHESSLDKVASSRAFKMASKTAALLRQAAPPESRRRRVLRLGYRAMTAVPKLRNPRWLVQMVRMLASRARDKLARLMLAFPKNGKRAAGPMGSRRLLLSDPPRFPVVDHVDVSIIIPVFNHWRDSLACLQSITSCRSKLAYEVVVIDDGSSDKTPEMLEQIAGLVALRNDQNLGFIGSCNRGAAAARGEYLVFLNNDTLVTPGWLDALAQTFAAIPGTGLAGAKLVYPDRRLQEAGSVIWRDGTGWNYGKYDDADHPSYNFAREVDYCSGACVMVPHALFWQLGGFDSEFAPAYYEDTDLAFKIRHAGHKVIYQPHAKIVHHEGLTSGTNLESGVKSYQVVNRSKFQRRWGGRLKDHAPPPPPDSDLNDYTRKIEVASRGQILVIDHRLPTPDRDGGSLRMMEMIRVLLRSGHHVTFIPDNLAVLPDYLESLQSIGVEVIQRPYHVSVPDYLRQHGHEFNLAIICRLPVAARRLTTVRRLAPRAKIVFDTVDLHFLRSEREARVSHDESLEAAIAGVKRSELRLARWADVTLVVSPVEKAILEAECPGIDVRIVSSIIPLDELPIPGFDGRRNIVFIGGFQHLPNADAVLYFAREIFPRIHHRLPDAVFQVIGPDAPPEVRRLASPNIAVLGYVPDVRPLFDRARLSVAPLRFGAGVKIKVNQSMAFGVPAVVTSIAAEGLHLVDGQNALFADDAEQFADAVVRLWSSRELWETLSTNGLENIREHFSVQAAARSINDLLLWAGLPVPAHRPHEWPLPTLSGLPRGQAAGGRSASCRPACRSGSGEASR
jgi:GT2 family glycosyltransferase/glycosyltransferase involved in cell wall biosynthesis